MAEIPFVGPSYQLTSRPASVQRTINLIPVPQEPGNERTAWVFKDAPGLVLVQDFAGPQLLDWLAYQDIDNTGPPMQSFGEFRPLNAPEPNPAGPVAFEIGLNWSYSQANDDELVYIPLSGGSSVAPDVVEGVNWFPDTPGGYAPSIVDSSPGNDPSGGVWTGYDWIVISQAPGVLVLTGVNGTTVLTFLISAMGGYYDGASVEYGELDP